MNKLYAPCPLGLWSLKSKIKTSETHNYFFLTSLSVTCLKVHVNTQKLSFASLFSFGMFLKFIYLFWYYLRERAWDAETCWLIYKYYLATPITSTGHLSHSVCSTSTLNAFLEPGLSVLGRPHPAPPLPSPSTPW